ncbi:MAG: hypothetical protein L0Z70_05420 [Chloroflexi bacterium]|nr:hypothetical protein [Chloroflexota bacterium]
MRRFTIALLIALLLTLSAASVALAGEGPHGGGFTATTDACAGCHRAHTAPAPGLLLETTQALCLTCHGSAATGADTNVTDGVYQNRDAETEVPAQGTPGAPLGGGGFSFYRLQGQAAFVATTSSHDVTGTVVDAWGYTGANTGETAPIASGLTCGSCHDPHGSTTNYRIIPSMVNGVAVTVTSLEANIDFTAENWGAGISEFCAACHPNYNAGGALTIGGTTHYRHEMNMNWSTGTNVNPETVGFQTYTLPLANSGQAGGDVVVCTTCHLPHGSSAAQDVNSAGANIAADSSLLRLDNRGVCEVCHQK